MTLAFTLVVTALTLITLLLIHTGSAEASGPLSIDVHHGDKDHLLLAASRSEFGLAFELWCYEAGLLHNGTGEKREDGSVVFTHRSGDVTGTTTFTPVQPDRIIMKMVATGPMERLKEASYLGPCMQYWHSDAFMRESGLPDFAERCFLYTSRGQVGMLETARGPMQSFDLDGEENNPPWTQWYVPLTRMHPGDIWSFGASGERPTHGLVGVTSKDGEWLAAIGSPNVRNLGQGWHDCIHHVPELEYDLDEAAGEIRHQSMIYLMPNDKHALLDAYRSDFAEYLGSPLEVTPVGPALIVKSPSGGPLRLQLEGEGLEQAVWEETWWGAWLLAGEGFQIWANASGNDLNLVAGLSNGRSIGADVSGAGWQAAASVQFPMLELAAPEARAAWFWERADAASPATGLPPQTGSNHVLRGRLHFYDESEAVDAPVQWAEQDWAQAVPITIPVE